MVDLKGKTFIITGASGGIGRALTLGLARIGVNLVLNAQHAAPLSELAAQCENLGINVHAITGNAAKVGVASKLVGAALAVGNFYGFLQAAGMLHAGPYLWELPEKHFREIFEASVDASHRLMHFAVPELVKQGEGLIVFFGSGAAERAIPGIAAYCAAKAAEEHLARQLAAEHPELTTFIYRPGTVETRMQEQARSAKGGAADHLHRIFRGIKERGELLSPGKSAGALINILTDAPRRFHGRIATWRDGPSE